MARSAPTVPYKPKPGEIPTNPGVYRFRDGDGRVLYVGKAKNLRAHVLVGPGSRFTRRPTPLKQANCQPWRARTRSC